MYFPGLEVKPGVSRKERYIVPVGCVEANHMMQFHVQIKEDSFLQNNN